MERNHRIGKWSAIAAVTMFVVCAFFATTLAFAGTRGDGASSGSRVGSSCTFPTHANASRSRSNAAWVKDLSSFATETLQVTVVPGSLRVEPARIIVSLHRVGDVLEGTLGPISVIDARGSYAGWVLSAHADSPDARGTVTFIPTDVHPVYPDETQGILGSAGHDDVRIACAAPETGAGTYSVSALVRVRARQVVDGVDLPVILRVR